ncbi:hypothetical protein Pmani_017889 [Petrolisthes manimaculis]|uniref:Uncharacterized protein n=1 Tax=Petrolisthes manimaculis TaxID=1843537 RepID=A0AAE1U5C4_9EUCA|nr:hypothetical protein Pmani_017889 [Petrolisthes manimaculis]
MDDGDKSSEVFKVFIHARRHAALYIRYRILAFNTKHIPGVRKPSSIILSPARNASIVHSMYTRTREDVGWKKEGIAKKGDGREETVKEGDGREGIAKKGDGREGIAKKGDGREVIAKKGDGREGTVKEGDGKEGIAKKGDGREGIAKKGDDGKNEGDGV